jgi:hypothetical protein
VSDSRPELIRLTPEEWVKLANVLIARLGKANVVSLAGDLVGLDNARLLVDAIVDDPLGINAAKLFMSGALADVKITKADTAAMAARLAAMVPGDRASDISWAADVAIEAFGDGPRTIDVIRMARHRVEEYEAATDPKRLEPLQDPNNRLLYPGNTVVWFSTDGTKEIWQRVNGYYAGRLGDVKAYDFEQKLVDQWDDMCAIYESISGDTTLRAGGPHVVAVFTSVKGWWNPSPGRSYIKETGEKTDNVPDLFFYEVVTASGHTFAFEGRNRGDYVGRPGTGAGDVRDRSGKVRASWSFNRTRWEGRSVGFRN